MLGVLRWAVREPGLAWRARPRPGGGRWEPLGSLRPLRPGPWRWSVRSPQEPVGRHRVQCGWPRQQRGALGPPLGPHYRPPDGRAGGRASHRGGVLAASPLSAALIKTGPWRAPLALQLSPVPVSVLLPPAHLCGPFSTNWPRSPGDGDTGLPGAGSQAAEGPCPSVASSQLRRGDLLLLSGRTGEQNRHSGTREPVSEETLDDLNTQSSVSFG